MRYKIFIYLGLLTAVFLFLSGNQYFLDQKNVVSQGLASIFSPLNTLVSSIGKSNSKDYERLVLENQELKAQILALAKNPRLISSNDRDFVVAKIFSTYPFNNHGLLTINAGTRQGIAKSQAATKGGNLFFGAIDQVFDNTSVIRTIYDFGWQLPVKVGDDSVDALLIGGREPRLTLILKNKNVESGQPVYSASADFPYGLKIGEVGEVTASLSSTYSEATLKVAYMPGVLDEVYVLRR